MNDDIRSLLKDARQKFEAAKDRLTQPYSSHDALCQFYETRGFWYGVGAALEKLEETKRIPTPLKLTPTVNLVSTETAGLDKKTEPCTCEQFGNGVISGNDGRLPPAEGCPRHGKSPW